MLTMLVLKIFTGCDPYFAIPTAKHYCDSILICSNGSFVVLNNQPFQSSAMGLLGVFLPTVCCLFLIQVKFGHPNLFEGRAISDSGSPIILPV